MSWEEFSMLSQGYANKREREIADIKFIAWHSMVGMRVDKIPSLEQFIGGKKIPKASVEQRAQFKKEAEEYYKRKKRIAK